MNAAIFASAFHPHLGGVEELVRQLALELRRRENVSAQVYTNRWPRSLPADEEYEGIPIHRIAMRVPDGSPKAHLNYHLTRQSIQNGMLATLRAQKTDLIHVQCVSSSAFYALGAKKHLGLPLVVTLQGELTMDATHLFQRSAFARNFMMASLREADQITACSEQTLREAEAFFGEPFGERGRVIYNGIRLADFGHSVPHSHPRPYVFALGRHVHQKGFDVLLRAFAAAITEGFSHAHDLLLAGDGEERAGLERLAAELRLGDRVQFVGRLDRNDVVRYFAGCSFFVLPSRQEPMGIVNLEAMAAKKAVIASRVGGVPELVRDGENGLLVPGEDVEALAGAIRCLANDAVLRDTMGHRGRALVERRFDWPVIADQYLHIYQQAAAKHD